MSGEDDESPAEAGDPVEPAGKPAPRRRDGSGFTPDRRQTDQPRAKSTRAPTPSQHARDLERSRHDTAIWQDWTVLVAVMVVFGVLIILNIVVVFWPTSTKEAVATSQNLLNVAFTTTLGYLGQRFIPRGNSGDERTRGGDSE